jgi:carboxypeptidase family protein
LTATKPGLANGIVRDFDASAGVPARIVMKSGGTITGHVSGLTDREMQSTTVTASSANGNASGQVDSSGSYRIEGAPTGTVRVSARSGQGFMAGGKTSPAKSVQVDPGASVQVDLEFKSATIIRGRVTRNGQPLANAAVGFMPRNAQAQTSASGTTDSSGSYEINGLDDASYNVSVMDFERTTPFSTTYDVHGSSTFDIDIKAAPLRGRVIDAATSEPIADAHVEIQLAQGESMLSSRGAVTDPSGVFLIDNVARGSYQAKAEKEGYGHQIKPISIGDTAPEDLEFKLSASSGVTLSVVDARDNRMLAANVIRIVDGRGQNIETGSFRFNNTPEPLKLTLSPGSYRVTLTAMGYAPSTVSVTSPSNQTVRMTPGGTLLLRSKSGSLRVRLVDQNGGFYPRGPNGIFMVDPSPLTTTLNNVIGGTYTLQVLDNSDRVINTVPVTVIDGQQTVIEVSSSS